MLEGWPESADLAREILLVEQEGDRITHDLSKRTNSTFVTPIDAEDIYNLASKVDDVVDEIEETADFMVLYRIDAPMEQALAMADILVKACERLSVLLDHLREFKDLDKYWIEIHRLENDGDRLFREAFASLFAGGIDPMVVIRWRGKASEAAVDVSQVDVYEVREGKIVRATLAYPDKATALEAVGRRE